MFKCNAITSFGFLNKLSQELPHNILVRGQIQAAILLMCDFVIFCPISISLTKYKETPENLFSFSIEDLIIFFDLIVKKASLTLFTNIFKLN